MNSRSQIAARTSIATIAVYHALLTAMIFIRPDLDPYWHTISEFAVGPYGWIMMIAFWTAAVSYTCLYLAISSEVSGFWGKVGIGILLICIVGLFGVGLFPTDPLGTRPENLSTIGILHVVFGASQMMLLPIAAFLINLNLIRRNSRWIDAKLPLLLTAFLPMFGLVGFMIHFSMYLAPLGEEAYGPDVPIGWPPRLLFLTYAIWLVTVAWTSLGVRTENRI